MTVRTFTTNPIQENTYVVSDATHEAAIIDCGCFTEQEWAEVHQYLESEQLKPVHLLNTHLHFDHSLGNSFVIRDYGLRPEASADDDDLYSHMRQQVAMFLGQACAQALDESFTALLAPPLTDGQLVSVGGLRLQVIATPGHTAGGLCFYCEAEHALFSGDTLFRGSMGRTDLPGGNGHDLVNSILDRLFTLPPDTTVYPGHGPQTTIGRELRSNPYLSFA